MLDTNVMEVKLPRHSGVYVKQVSAKINIDPHLRNTTHPFGHAIIANHPRQFFLNIWSHGASST